MKSLVKIIGIIGYMHQSTILIGTKGM